GELCPNTAEIRADKFAFGWKNIAVQPDIQPLVIRKAAQQRHRDMGMDINQAGQDILSRAIDDVICLKTLVDIDTGANCCDLAVLHGDGAIMDEIECAVHRDDDAPAENRIYTLHRVSFAMSRLKNCAALYTIFAQPPHGDCAVRPSE